MRYVSARHMDRRLALIANCQAPLGDIIEILAAEAERA
jgi:hypothetical protein